jgi:hypothetical protein
MAAVFGQYRCMPTEIPGYQIFDLREKALSPAFTRLRIQNKKRIILFQRIYYFVKNKLSEHSIRI